MKRFTFLFAIVLLIIGCHNKETVREGLKASTVGDMISEDELIFDDEMEAPRSMEPPSPKSPDSNDEIKDVTKIIKEGSITMEVDSLSLAKSTIDSIVSTSGAYYENETFNGAGRNFRFTLKIRIPNTSFERFVFSLETGRGRITNKSIQAKDVTSDYVDLKIRLDNNKAYLDQYRELLKRATSMKDILEIQEKSRRIESEIDAQLGRMKYINDQVKYSTLTLNVYQKYVKRNIVSAPSFLSRIWKSVSVGFNGLIEFLIVVVSLWPLFIVIGLLIWSFKAYRKRRIKN